MEEILKADSDSIHDLLNSSDLTPDQIEIFQRLLSGGVNSKTTYVSANEAYRIFALCGQNIASYYDTNARYQLKEGTISLINKMIEDGKPEVRLNTPVKRIEQKSDHVVITTRAGEILTAATLVCTIPLNVLKDVEFSPSLDPGKLAASKEGHPGKGFKVFAQTKGEAPKVLLYGNKDIGFDEALTYHIGKESSLIACFGNDRADFDTNDADKMQKALEQFLPGIEVTGSYGYDWIADPYSQGTWCVWRPDWYRKYGKGLRDGAEGRVFFASADFCAGNRGYIDGAIGSGIKAAQQIKELLG
ncbi:FAD-dependent oxidoreductase [Pseudomonas sp. TH41]|uniref:flavin monoamine oxidase family protein n=1 Tax=Pseudomonas sp. TH41 TaxID=2796405 RepID=UPI00191311D2|nr:FAD-dependent oxidoreductase [Pseudomonas sp. TH41]MBK5356564.1 FAD-dependent oxidoreductase [Pseudomonas sp. TH41]